MPRVAYWTGKKRPSFSKEWRENMGMAHKGLKPSEETRKKIGDAQRGEKAHSWKGDNVGYQGMHIWIRKTYGKATICEQNDGTCSKRMFDWANISGQYKRDIEDYMQLCRSHHVRYDKNWIRKG